jgi:hypothetical protein
MNNPVVSFLGDLNGDGQPEVLLDVPGTPDHDIHVLEPQPEPTCYREVLQGRNLTITVAPTQTLGWRDLNVSQLMAPISHGGQLAPRQNLPFVGKYDGQKYVLVPNMK